MAATILIVDDEFDLLDTLEFNLRNNGFLCRRAHNGTVALEMAQMEPVPDMVLLDLMLPDIPGTEVCRVLRSSDRTRHIPIVMLTAKDDEVDRIVGLEIGADDYVTKPFSIRELVLRVRAILRRAGSAAETPKESELIHGELRIDQAGHRVWVGPSELTLTALEFKLLTTLITRSGRVQTRDALLTDVWGMQTGVSTRTVDTHVTRLRRKLGAAGGYIETLRGVGYRFKSEPTVER